MAKSRDDLIYEALFNLGVLSNPGQIAGTEEYNTVDSQVDPTLEYLIGKDIVFIQDVDAIEDQYFLPLGHVLAAMCRARFGVLGTRDSPEIAALGQKGELDLQALSAVRPTYQPLEIIAY